MAILFPNVKHRPFWPVGKQNELSKSALAINWGVCFCQYLIFSVRLHLFCLLPFHLQYFRPKSGVLSTLKKTFLTVLCTVLNIMHYEIYNTTTILNLDIANIISLSSPCPGCPSPAIKKYLPDAVNVHSPPRWTSAFESGFGGSRLLHHFDAQI